MRINLHIERLILDGVDLSPAERLVLQAALETELGRLLAQGGIGADLAGGGAVPSVRASGFEMDREKDPARFGQQIAGAIYGGIAR